MDDDRISSLPEGVKHHIISFLPNIKDVGRICSLSKLWLWTSRSFQISNFRGCIIAPNVALLNISGNFTTADDSSSFIRFLDDALMRSHDGMLRLNLYTNGDMVVHVDRWFGMALDHHVKELSFNHFSLDEETPYSIPGRVFSAEFIKSLKFTGNVKIGGIGNVSLPSLRSLSLSLSRITDQMFRRLLRSCPLLEDLSVQSCSLLSEIELSNLDHLKSVSVTGGLPDFLTVSINAPALERLCLRGKFLGDQSISLVVHKSLNLRSLELAELFLTDEWFCLFLSQFPLLESLTLSGFRLWKRIWISNPLLKEIMIAYCNNLEDIRIETPKLSTFSYQACCGVDDVTPPSIWAENPPDCCAAGFTFSFFHDHIDSCFQELQNILTRWATTFRCQESTVIYLYEVQHRTM
ncbi:F-box/LRR-repeat protein At3g58930-like [Punica granatum]|uniref:F-box/LRR-repeat protein At3g58930-like n=1 Tax=Punica granatum TaxID=22663 RepID=A0A218XXH2_PUNGR|nr:F-box/LRR-repeat protein At3g58930-like [Punica granatum]OWM89211.1 hypothetical protein CDL15_Pgr010498 [Punica granatum]